MKRGLGGVFLAEITEKLVEITASFWADFRSVKI